MEIIIFVAVIVVAALLWSGYVKTKKTEFDHAIDNWQPPKAEDKPWPYGEKVAEGKIHVKSADVAPGKSETDRVETPAPVVTNSNPADNIPVVTNSNPAKKAPAKKRQFEKKPADATAPAKKPAVKKTPAKKKST